MQKRNLLVCPGVPLGYIHGHNLEQKCLKTASACFIQIICSVTFALHCTCASRGAF